jgi:hypothetical protein
LRLANLADVLCYFPLWVADKIRNDIGVEQVARPAKGKRGPPHLLYAVTFSSWHHGYRNPHFRVAHIKQKIPAFDEIDIAVVGVCPSSRPGLADCEPVATIREVLMACHHSHTANGKVVLTSKVRAKMLI